MLKVTEYILSSLRENTSIFCIAIKAVTKMKVFFFLIIGDFMKKQITLFFFPFYVPIIYQVAASVV